MTTCETGETAQRGVMHHRTVLPALPAHLLPRERIVTRILSTPPGGVCVLDVAPGFGRTTALALAARRASAAPTEVVDEDGTT